MDCCKRKHKHKKTECFDIVVLTLCLRLRLYEIFHSENERNGGARLQMNNFGITNQSKKIELRPQPARQYTKNMADVSVDEKLAEAVRSYPVL